ncbi:hypothetical protein F0562_010027 [Nyssa sinensis]|uniref:Uncharacterized protein n=1 Tax=Nyssa sinensis TaxID=561372 RepID=A0A5J5A0C3_9ASTE|nr:hypothetical protein F0562_010027 [Nyssa sinensis]
MCIYVVSPTISLTGYLGSSSLHSAQFPKPVITGRTKTKRRPFLGQELGFRLSSLQLSGHFFGGCHSGC